MDKLSDFIVIGSGPSAVSAAWPLVKSGATVTMLEASSSSSKDIIEFNRSDLRTLRSTKKSNHLWKNDYSGLRDLGFASPKLRTANGMNYSSEYHEKNKITQDNYRNVGALAVGGLSRVWGAVCCEYDELDFGCDITFSKDMKDSYREVSKRIGISGDKQSDNIQKFLGPNTSLLSPLAQTENAKQFANKVIGRRLSDEFLVGQPNVAVITRDYQGRKACSLDFACMWGCKNKSIYNAQYDLSELIKFPNFKIKYKHFVDCISKNGQNWAVKFRCSDKNEILCKKVILALGTVATNSLLMRSKLTCQDNYKLLSNPAFSFALINPMKIGSGITSSGYGNSQIFFKIPEPIHKTYSFGLLYDAGSMCASDIARHMPFSMGSSLELAGYLMEATLLGLTYLPGSFTNSEIINSKNGEIRINGSHSSDYKMAQKNLRKNLRFLIKDTGFFLIPFSFKAFKLGADAHYAGGIGTSDECIDGKMINFSGLYVVDGAALSCLPAKNPTLTYMANADRISKNALKSTD